MTQGEKNRDAEREKREEQKKKRQQVRALIVGTLTAGGVFQLNSWQVQAHGNRSSHSVAALQSALFRPQDYVLMRQQLTQPEATETIELAQATEQLRELMRSPAAINSTALSAIAEKRNNLEKTLQVTPTTRKSLTFLEDNDPDAAIAVIEGHGVPERVLGEYLFTLMDIAYLGRDGERFTAEHMKEFIAIAKAAMTYSEKALASLETRSAPQDAAIKVRVAEIYHNIASFTLPDDGVVTDADLELGRSAALRALALRQQLEQPYETMIAHWMVGKHFLRSQDYDSARRHLETSIETAEAIRNAEGQAWAKTTLAKVARATNDMESARKLDADVQRVVDGVTRTSNLIELLQLERDS